MTPAARVQAAIEIVETIRAGQPAEKALTNWARGARYAGSKDRAAVRDHVFDVVRRWRSSAALGGGEGGRARLLGLLRGQGVDPDGLFTGASHAPAPLTREERAAGSAPTGAEGWDLPDWLADRFRDSLGSAAEETALALRHRADVFLRVNLLRSDPASARARLKEEGITTEPHPLSPTALRVTKGARAVARSTAFAEGLVELQDVASQAVTDLLPLRPGLRVLDYCAGGGGKALAMAARMGGGPVAVHDADPARMSDLPARAARAGARLSPVARPEPPYDLVLCDVPCSGSGAWRRAPEGKWRLDPDGLAGLLRVQAEILDTCAALVGPGGRLAYATCSVLSQENAQQIDGFRSRRAGWHVEDQRQFLPSDGGDGFFITVLKRAD
ncbi:RsmB/NOP family class I SAM-dependent RNA methyltransferase [Pseudoponticoccus marisrubri]|uniref:SAM-dependent methyltransferase n=1 Tax=Pseudoponticoccus marisrubri TaxID=1685382 RepID=A0A0W7WLT0_9RHOB|nr:RsmB/NOP family class I SAM-dependent RNA methyltransferase [Pseudoponticoccus marisrubri]KUF11549.1 SAM-dependent methyltransferase [Pseudoponticoccus marisrubri]